MQKIKYLLIGDYHKEDGNKTDITPKYDQELLDTIDKYKDYKPISLGDFLDLWARPDERIFKNNLDFLKELGKRRLTIIPGNHDRDLLKKNYWLRKELENLGIIIEHHIIFRYGLVMSHGHYGDTWNFEHWQIGKLLTKYKEFLEEHDPELLKELKSLVFSVARNDDLNEKAYEVAKVKNPDLKWCFFGHTHKVSYSKKYRYFNVGYFPIHGAWLVYLKGNNLKITNTRSESYYMNIDLSHNGLVVVLNRTIPYL